MKLLAIFFTPVYLIWFIAVSLISVVLFVPFYLFYGLKLRKIAFRYGKILAIVIGALYLAGAFTRFSVKGKENIPKKERRLCIMANHQSYADILFMTIAMKFNVGFVAKKELFRVPILRQWMRLLNCISIDRSNPRKTVQAIRAGIERIRSGFPMAIFPEATRSRGNGIRRFRGGSFKLAYKSEAVILPVTIDGAFRLFEDLNLVLPFQRVIITIHPPVDSNLLSDEEKEKLPEELWRQVNGGLRFPNREKLPDRNF